MRSGEKSPQPFLAQVPEQAQVDEVETFARALACPTCGGDLALSTMGALCTRCQERFPRTSTGAPDLRLKSQKTATLVLDLLAPAAPDPSFFAQLSSNPSPALDMSGMRVPWHLSSELLSWFPKASQLKESLALDLGCGSTVHREVCEYAGFHYVGLDLNSARATLLGDAHALPFKAESFDFILSIAVLEHVRLPFVALKEAHRVLKPGGVFVGSVAFLEPFHENSHYHHTHLGTWNSLTVGGFEVVKLGPSPRWTGLVALATMSLFPRLPEALARLLTLPLRVAHRLWWWLGSLRSPQASEHNRLLWNAGAFYFVARRR
jgi:SAM-dependent methyltransferase